MKIKRQKHAKKTLGFYRCSFGLREPFQVLLCGTFCQAALKGQIQLKEQLPKYLQGEVSLCTTSCVLKELEALGKELYGAKLIAQRFQVRHCSHFKNPVGGSECLLSMIADGNPHHYFVATQEGVTTAVLREFGSCPSAREEFRMLQMGSIMDQELADKIKKRAGVPLLFIIQNTIVLDKPSPKSLAFIQAVQTNQLVPVHQKKSIEVLKDEKGLVKDSNRRGKKRKRTSGPNPLSCMKKGKKGPTSPTPPSTAAKKKRKRKRAKSERNTAPA